MRFNNLGILCMSQELYNYLYKNYSYFSYINQNLIQSLEKNTVGGTI